jgi:hypothetical protein
MKTKTEKFSIKGKGKLPLTSEIREGKGYKSMPEIMPVDCFREGTNRDIARVAHAKGISLNSLHKQILGYKGTFASKTLEGIKTGKGYFNESLNKQYSQEDCFELLGRTYKQVFKCLTNNTYSTKKQG